MKQDTSLETVPGHKPPPAPQGNPSMTSNPVDSFWLPFKLYKIGTIPHDIFCMWLPLFSTQFVRFAHELVQSRRLVIVIPSSHPVARNTMIYLSFLPLMWVPGCGCYKLYCCEHSFTFQVHLHMPFCWAHTLYPTLVDTNLRCSKMVILTFHTLLPTALESSSCSTQPYQHTALSVFFSF